jgi:SAM-dependent methyltransferase
VRATDVSYQVSADADETRIARLLSVKSQATAECGCASRCSCRSRRNGWRLAAISWHSAPVPKIYFDERIAKGYETLWPELFEPAFVDPAVSFLADLAGTGAALELGIGTGRLALPLSQRGVRVHGIELSPAMVAQLQAKPGSDDIGVTIGDFADTKVGGAFQLAYLVRNTITNLTTQDEQVACFRNVAAHLEPGGCFVIEVYIPELQRLPPGETIHVFTRTQTHLGFEEYDLATQLAFSHHYWMVDGQLETFSSPHRYVWPAELDLMARLAGMTLRERWSGWNREPFTSDSRQHISVWEKPS